MWKDGSWILNQDSTQFPLCEDIFRETQGPLMENPPYSKRVISPPPEGEICVEQHRLKSTEAVKANLTILLNSVSDNEMHHCF